MLAKFGDPSDLGLVTAGIQSQGYVCLVNVKSSDKNELAISASLISQKGSMNTRKQLNIIKISILPPGVPKSKCVTR